MFRTQKRQKWPYLILFDHTSVLFPRGLGGSIGEGCEFTKISYITMVIYVFLRFEIFWNDCHGDQVTIGRDIPGPLWVFGCAAAEPLPKLQQGLAETERCFGMLWTGSRVWRGTRANTGVARIRNPVEVVQYSSVPFPVNSQTYLIWRSIAGRLFGGSYINSLPLLRDVHWNQYHPVSICGVPEGAGLAKWFSVRNGAGGVYVSPKKSCFTPFAPSSRGCSWFALVGNPQRNLTVWSKGLVRECVVPA